MCNHSNSDIGIVGYANEIEHKEHSPNVWQIFPETSCISHTNVSKFTAVLCELIRETWTTTFLELCREQWIADCSSVLFVRKVETLKFEV